MSKRLANPLVQCLALSALLPALAQAAPMQSAGPDTFDWIVRPGVTMYFDTVEDIILGGDGVITDQRVVHNGVIDVRGVIIPATSTVVFLGPNPVTILASGDVNIAGKLELSGAPGLSVPIDSPGLRGASGRAGGGRGGDSSPMASAYSARGGHGQGAFGRPQAGGKGGESSFHPLQKNARRGSGGGGGRFGPDIPYTLLDAGLVPRDVQCQTRVGMDAEPGFDGGPDGTGAQSLNARAKGGRMGLVPFQDGSDANDFYGMARTLNGLVVGELEQPWAGSGGGAGGDAIRSDSYPPAGPASGEIGAPGGGGGGSLTILAMGEIVIHPTGEVHADGGAGGQGENTNFFDRVSGAGGGGSGGHIIFQSATRISVLALADGTGNDYDDPPMPGMSDLEHPRRPISARGGQGGVGKDNTGGAREAGEGTWKCDGIDRDRLTVFGLSVPPLEEACYDNLDGPPTGSVPGAGGDGGPGLIQLHVPDPERDLIFADPDLTKIFLPRPVGWRDGRFTMHLLPTLGPIGALHQRELERRRRAGDGYADLSGAQR